MLRGHRHSAGLTLEELAQRSGVSARAIGDMERGRSKVPQARTVEALALALGLDEADTAELRTSARANRRLGAGPSPNLCGLPPEVPDFVGRDEESAWLTGAPAGIAVLSGAPGLGKTALAVHAARQSSERYPDGCFFLDLRGLDATPVAPDRALRRLLRALGVREEEIPRDGDECRSLYQHLVRDWRALVLLDNAADEAQLRPLLPGAGRAAVWVTSRRALTGIEHARRLTVRPLHAAHAVDLLGSITGLPRDAVLGEIAERCGRFPLALRIAGNRLLSRPDRTARDLADQLAAEDLRLQRLTAGDLRVRSAFTLSYERLAPPSRLLFRRLALVPGPDFGDELGSVLTGLPRAQVEELMDELVELGLLRSAAVDRAAFHDLLRLYAKQRLHEEEGAAEIGAARARMNGWLRETATVAGRWFAPDSREAVDSQEAVRRWLRTEQHHWFAAYRETARAGSRGVAASVAESMDRFFEWWTGWGYQP
ncbi:helix-turn-helix domain-containing protein [Kitasatospora brasiliensis]|uniref:helix-turn-helix domain-containing protein n=1 Tax=Kitasatospora brasiliensis TaxID=3058040 RepID=UPI00292E551E|nr:helix-turn-helix domain-containing protein [Kitasatospora sp. K002]